MSELVSIITPSYNTALYIGQTIEGVLAQTHTNWELIIVDDCSKDDTDSIVQKYLLDSRIRYIKNKKNSGAAVSRNRALQEAKGKWIAFLDSDDVWAPEKLEKQIKFMKSRNCHFSYTNYEEIDAQSQPLGVFVSGPKKISRLGMLGYCWMGCLTVMYDREYIGLIQIKDIKKNNDYAIWLEVSKEAECYLLNECLAQYRKRSGSISRQGIKTMIGWHYKLWHEIEDKSVVASVWWTFINLVCGFYKKVIYVKR